MCKIGTLKVKIIATALVITLILQMAPLKEYNKLEYKLHAADDLIYSDIQKSNDNIFFIDTSLRRMGLNEMQACSVESAARLNPDKNVHVLVTSKVMYADGLNEIAATLLEYKNVRISRIILLEFVKYTPIEDIFANGTIYFVKHLISEFLRILVLWKFGGIYIDFDVLVVRALGDLGYDWIAKDTIFTVNNAVVSLSDSVTGRMFANKFLQEHIRSYHQDPWKSKGSDALKTVILTHCRTGSTLEVIRENCHGFKVYSEDFLFPVASWKDYYSEVYLDSIIGLTSAYAHHFQRHRSGNYKPLPSEDVAFTYLVQNYCPKIFHLKEDEFFEQY